MYLYLHVLTYVVTFVQDIFEGLLTNITECEQCRVMITRDEPFLDISLDVNTNISITAALNTFSKRELLHGSEQYMCDTCRCRQDAYKSFKFKRLPQCLILHLKRFQYLEQQQSFIKRCDRVVFPMQLKILNTVPECLEADQLYELFAIVVHIGTGIRYGHYIAIIKKKHTWYVYDDDHVTEISEEQLQLTYGSTYTTGNQDAYLLFYQTVKDA